MKKTQKKCLTLSETSVKVYFDGGCWPNPNGPMKIGIYIPSKDIRHHEVVGVGTNNLAECIAALKAISFLYKLGLQREEIEVLGDSKLIINQINGIWKIKNSKLAVYHASITANLLSFHNIKFHWIPRAQNSIADSLTKLQGEYNE